VDGTIDKNAGQAPDIDAGSNRAPVQALLRVKTGRAWLGSAIGAGIVLLAAILAASFFLRARRPGAATPVRSMAVLPFKPLVADSRDEALEMGLSDALITRLGSIRELVVPPTSSVSRYHNLDQDPLKTARELHVDAVLDGHVQKFVDRIRITAQLLSAEDGRQLWTQQFEEKFTDVFALEDSMSKQIAAALLLKLTRGEEKSITRHYTESSQAYQEYVLGRYLWSKRTLDGLYHAIKHYQEATAIDPNYALAYAGIADCYFVLDEEPPRQVMPKAEQAALAAVRIAPELAEAHSALGKAKMYYDLDWPGAETEFKVALGLDPNSANIHLAYSGYLTNCARFDEAYRERKRALELDPLSLMSNKTLAGALFRLGQMDEAIAQYQKTLEMDPGFAQAQREIGLVYEKQARYSEALAALRKALELPGNHFKPTNEADICYVLAVSGRTAEARKALGALIDKSKSSYVSPYDIAIAYCGLGQKELALDWLDKAYDDRSKWLVQLKVDYRLDPLRSDPHFVDLLRRTGIP